MVTVDQSLIGDHVRRRYTRLACAVPVVLRERQGSWRLVTENVSRGGAFVVTDGAKAERQLVQLDFELPRGPVNVLGMVAWRATLANQSNACRPGMGIDFFAVSREDRDRWDAFVLNLEDSERPIPLLPEDASVAPMRRQYARHASCFAVRLPSKDRMREFYTQDISAGGMFLRHAAPEQVGRSIEVVLLHPDTQSEFPLRGEVVRLIRDAPLAERGVAVRFERLPSAEEAALVGFIETGVDFLEQYEQTAERLDLLREAAQLEDESPLPLVALGQMMLSELDPESAVEWFQAALDRDPLCLPAHRGLYKAFNMLDVPEKAKMHYDLLRYFERALPRRSSFPGLPGD